MMQRKGFLRLLLAAPFARWAPTLPRKPIVRSLPALSPDESVLMNPNFGDMRGSTYETWADMDDLTGWKLAVAARYWQTTP